MVSKGQKASAQKWDKVNMRSISCRVRTNIAEDFKLACEINNTSPGALLKEFVNQYIAENSRAIYEHKVK